VSNRSKAVFLLDDLIGGYLQSDWNHKIEFLGSLPIDDQLELARLRIAPISKNTSERRRASLLTPRRMRST
jgi:hypothetical protein